MNMQDLLSTIQKRQDDLSDLIQYAVYCEAIHRDGVKPVTFEEWVDLRKAMSQP